MIKISDIMLSDRKGGLSAAVNIMRCFTPKSEVVCVYDNCTLRQVMEKMELHNYIALPVLTSENRYTATVTAGDILRFCKAEEFSSIRDAEKIGIREVPLHLHANAVKVDTDPKILFDALLKDNFIPVEDDRGYFIGIVTRRRYLETFCRVMVSD